ncbi:hypothetical protein NL676_024369 [Syzygium grande]|nr:hypothetical protein NL676_024369 [Syzygium grande]
MIIDQESPFREPGLDERLGRPSSLGNALARSLARTEVEGAVQANPLLDSVSGSRASSVRVSRSIYFDRCGSSPLTLLFAHHSF